VVEGKVFLFDFNWFVYGFWISLGGVFSGDSVGAGGGGGGDCVLMATGLGEEETVGFLFGKRVIVEKGVCVIHPLYSLTGLVCIGKAF